MTAVLLPHTCCCLTPLRNGSQRDAGLDEVGADLDLHE